MGGEEEEPPGARAVTVAEKFMWRSEWKQVRKAGKRLLPLLGCLLIRPLQPSSAVPFAV